MFHVSLCRNVRSLSNSLYTQVLQSLTYHIIYPLGFFIHQVLRSNILTVLSIHNQLTFLSFGVQFFQPFSFAAANTSSGQYITQTFPNKSLSAYMLYHIACLCIHVLCAHVVLYCETLQKKLQPIIHYSVMSVSCTTGTMREWFVYCCARKPFAKTARHSLL